MRYLLCIIFTLAVAAHASDSKRVASINLCTDQLLYLLEDSDNIVSLSYLSSDEAYSPIARQAKIFHANHASVEEILAVKPELVLAGSYSSSHVVHALRQLGIAVKQINLPLALQDIENTILTVGETISRSERARQLIQTMQARKSALQTRVAGTKRPLAVIIAPNGFTHGKNSMKGDILEMAHYENLAATIGIEGNGYIDMETLIKHQPEFIILEDSSPNKNSLSQKFLQHPALENGLPDTRYINVPPNLWSCGTPYIMGALEKLVNAHPREQP